MDETGLNDDELFSMEDLEKDLKKGRGGRRWLWFLVGSAVGVGATLATPTLLAPYLPSFLQGSREILKGPVLAEERTEDRLLLTIDTEPGALIASFSERVDEIALLVDPGDIVTISVPDYEPFVENPDFEGIQKGSPEDRTGIAESEELPDGDSEAAGDATEPEASATDTSSAGAMEPGDESPDSAGTVPDSISSVGASWRE